MSITQMQHVHNDLQHKRETIATCQEHYYNTNIQQLQHLENNAVRERNPLLPALVTGGAIAAARRNASLAIQQQRERVAAGRRSRSRSLPVSRSSTTQSPRHLHGRAPPHAATPAASHLPPRKKRKDSRSLAALSSDLACCRAGSAPLARNLALGALIRRRRAPPPWSVRRRTLRPPPVAGSPPRGGRWQSAQGRRTARPLPAAGAHPPSNRSEHEARLGAAQQL
jgi:hypothetical protein